MGKRKDIWNPDVPWFNKNTNIFELGWAKCYKNSLDKTPVY